MAKWAEAICGPHRQEVAKAADRLGITVVECDVGRRLELVLDFLRPLLEKPRNDLISQEMSRIGLSSQSECDARSDPPCARGPRSVLASRLLRRSRLRPTTRRGRA